MGKKNSEENRKCNRLVSFLNIMNQNSYHDEELLMINNNRYAVLEFPLGRLNKQDTAVRKCRLFSV